MSDGARRWHDAIREVHTALQGGTATRDQQQDAADLIQWMAACMCAVEFERSTRGLTVMTLSIELLRQAHRDALIEDAQRARDALAEQDASGGVWTEDRVALAQAIADGDSLPVIARRWGVAHERLRQQTRSLRNRLGVATQVGLVVAAVRAGVVHVEPLDIGALTDRRRGIADLVAEGLTNDAIGHRLHLAQDTARTHIRRVFETTGCRTRAELAGRVIAAGMSTLDEVAA